jgi:hypothetical protein
MSSHFLQVINWSKVPKLKKFLLSEEPVERSKAVVDEVQRSISQGLRRFRMEQNGLDEVDASRLMIQDHVDSKVALRIRFQKFWKNHLPPQFSQDQIMDQETQLELNY